jgi:hypothetical protein
MAFQIDSSGMVPAHVEGQAAAHFQCGAAISFRPGDTSPTEIEAQIRDMFVRYVRHVTTCFQPI